MMVPLLEIYVAVVTGAEHNEFKKVARRRSHRPAAEAPVCAYRAIIDRLGRRLADQLGPERNVEPTPSQQLEVFKLPA